jgi:hypothetical protein
MNHPGFKDSGFAWLLAWRAILAAIALYTALEKPFWTMLTSLVVLGARLSIGEGVFKSKMHFEQKRLREQKERELRERRAEEARLRREAMEATQGTKRRLMSLDLDDDEPSPGTATGPTGATAAMSASDFDTALLHGDFERTQERRGAALK